VTRTLWVTNDFPPRPGGIEHFVGGLTDRLPSASTRVLTSRWPGDDAFDATRAYRVDRIGHRPLLPSPRRLHTIRLAAEEHAADVVVFGAAWPLGELAHRLEQPTFGLTHGHEAGMVRIGLGPLLRRMTRALDAVGVISEFTRDALEPWIAEGTQFIDLPPGVDIDRFHAGVDGSEVRQRYGIGEDQPLVVCISRLVARKGQDILLEAWPAVRERVPGAHLLIAGEGPREQSLRRRWQALGLQSAVTFNGRVTGAELPKFHAAADLFAMPCRTLLAGFDMEGLGIVYLEAQASGKAVIAGRSGGAPETVLDGESGLVVDGGSVNEVADAIVALLRDPERRIAMGKAGRAFVEECYAWPVIMARLQAVLDDLAAT
jgi:phosphatidyl-myo-inositol dimannoside synthase